MNELDFIRHLQKTIRPGKGVKVGIGDDAAVLDYTAGKYMLFASDMIIEGRHFRGGIDPFGIGWKAVSVNVSDIAAMGGVPRYVLISAGVPSRRSAGTLKRILAGAREAAALSGAAIVGGDTNVSGSIVLDVSIIGEVEKKHLALRSGAEKGDLIFVTGTLGNGPSKHLDFIPRLKESRYIVTRYGANAMIDVSDGLSIDLTRLARASRKGAVIYKKAVPVSGNAGKFESVNYGEDFELLFTMPPARGKRLMKDAMTKGWPEISLIGEIVDAKNGIKIIGADGARSALAPDGYAHF